MQYAIQALTDQRGMDTGNMKLFVICSTLLTLVVTGLGAELEQKALEHLSTAPRAIVAPDSRPPEPITIEIIRDRFLMLVTAISAIGGGVVCVMLRIAWSNKSIVDGKEVTAVSRFLINAFFSVSVITSMATTPWTVKRYLHNTPEDCSLVAFLVAVGAWVGWEIIAIIGERIKKAAESRGIAGVKDELAGRSIATVNTPAPTKQDS